MTPGDSMSCDQFLYSMTRCGFDPLTCHEQHIAIAVSGGSDSLALTLLLKDYAQKYDLKLTALCVDHGIRKDSQKEAIYVKNLLNEWGISCHILTIQTDLKTQKDLQNRARQARLSVIQSWCLQNDCQHVFFAHHKDDQRETQIMRLRQNSGLLGLSGIQPKRFYDGIYLYRPLLSYTKKALQTFLETHSISWVEDPSNQNLSYERVYWRHYSEFNLPKTSIGPDINDWVWRFVHKHGHLNPLGYATLDKTALQRLPMDFQMFLFRTIIHGYGDTNYPPSDQQVINLILSLMASKASAGTLAGLRISHRKSDIVFAREYKRCISFPIEPGIKRLFWDTRFLVTIPKDIQKTAMTISPLGSSRWQQLVSNHKEFKTIEHPRYALWSLPVLHWETITLFPKILTDLCEFGEDRTFSAIFMGKSMHQSFSFS